MYVFALCLQWKVVLNFVFVPQSKICVIVFPAVGDIYLQVQMLFANKYMNLHKNMYSATIGGILTFAYC